MTLLRAIRDDLVEKRLWPLAVVLLVALVAVPVVLTRSTSAPDEGPLPDLTAKSPAVSGSGAQPVVLRVTRPAKPRGAYHDPFRKGPRGGSAAAASTTPSGVATTVTPTDAPAAPAAASAGTGASGSGTPTPATTAPAAARPVTPAPAPERAAARSAPQPAPARYAAGYRVDWSWGPTASSRRTRDAARLTALRSGTTPELLFLGVRPDGRTAAFLVLTDATATGDGNCRPTAGYCHVIELKAGDSQFFDVQATDGIVQHELHLDRVSERRAATARIAQRQRGRVSRAGRTLLVETVSGGRTFVRRFVYAQRRGVLVFSAHGLGDRQ